MLPLFAASVPLKADPLEPFNRGVFGLNSSIGAQLEGASSSDLAATVADPLVAVIGNVSGNLHEPLNFTNALLQGRECAAGVSLRRFLMNSTLGIGGIFDVAATKGGLAAYRTDFGETLGVWGVPSGPYLVLPALGPTNARGVAGAALEMFADPVNVPVAMMGSNMAGTIVGSIQIVGDSLDSGVHAQGADNNTVSDLYLGQKQAFEADQAASLAGYICPEALNNPIWK